MFPHFFVNRLIPAKLMRDWMDLFVAGQPQYFVQEPDTEQGEADEEKYQVQLDELRHQLLNETDFEEYKVITLLRVIRKVLTPGVAVVEILIVV